VFWNDKGLAFFDITRSWSVGGAAVFDSLAATLREFDVFDRDERLRGWLAEVLDQLAGDLERGDGLLFPFLRWLEGLFPSLTAMMQEEQSGSKVWDYDLARTLANLFTRTAGADRATMIAMLREGTNNIICLQPFGCIANHITGKGVENKLKEMFPALNLLSLDMDAGVSEVNILNRLHLMVSEAREETARDKETTPRLKTVRSFAIPNALPRELQAFSSYTTLEVEKWGSWVSNLELWEKARKIRRRISL